MMEIPIYQKYLSQDDVNRLVEFYQTDAGRKMISAQPQIMQESMVVWQSWGNAAARRAFDKLQQNAAPAAEKTPE